MTDGAVTNVPLADRACVGRRRLACRSHGHTAQVATELDQGIGLSRTEGNGIGRIRPGPGGIPVSAYVRSRLIRQFSKNRPLSNPQIPGDLIPRRSRGRQGHIRQLRRINRKHLSHYCHPSSRRPLHPQNPCCHPCKEPNDWTSLAASATRCARTYQFRA
jgi:hypothetical protein